MLSKKRTTPLLVLLALSLSWGCQDKPGATKAEKSKPSVVHNNQPSNNLPLPKSVDPPMIDIKEHNNLRGPETTLAGRRPHRLSVDHLRRSVPSLFGQQWANGRGQSYFDIYSAALGEPDFVNSNQESRDPAPLFAKSMDDMAGTVCRRALIADADQENEAQRQILRYRDDVDKNLRFLKLKFHGIYTPEGCDDSIADLRKLFEETNAVCDQRGELCKGNGEPACACPSNQKLHAGWLAVCVAVSTDPEFMAY